MKNESLKADKIIKGEFLPPPIIKRNKIINLNQNNNYEFKNLTNRSREEIVSQA